MSASITNAQNPPIAASQTAAAANSPASGSSANVAAGSAQPTARSSYANATKKISSPPIASSAAPPVAVGGPQNAQHGKSLSVSPVNGSNPIKPAVPAMGPTIVNSSGANGAPSQGDHSRKSSVTISAAGTTGYIPNGGPVASSRAPSNLTFGSMAGSPSPSHAAPHHPQGSNLNPQAQNPRVASPSHSPSPIPTPISSGGKPDTLPGRPGLVFGVGSDSAEQNVSLSPAPTVNPIFSRMNRQILTHGSQNRPLSMPPQPNAINQAQHLRRESSQSGHSDMSNQAMNRGFPPNGRGRGGFNNFSQMNRPSPQQHNVLPYQPRGANMPPAFQPQNAMNPNSPFRQNRSPHISPAIMNQQAHMANPQMSYYQYQQQPVRIPSTSVSSAKSELSKLGPSRPIAHFQVGFQFSPVSVGSRELEFRLPSGLPIFHSIDPPFSTSFGYDQYLTTVQHQNMFGMPAQGLDPYGNYYGGNYPPQNFGLQQSMHYPGAPVPPSPNRGHSYPHQGPYPVGVPGYGAPPQAQGMARTPSNMSEQRPPSAAAQPSTPAMTNVSQVSHTHTPSGASGSPAPSSSNFTIPPKTKSKAIVVSDAVPLNFNRRANT